MRADSKLTCAELQGSNNQTEQTCGECQPQLL